MPIRIEFYGIPRTRAGCASVDVEGVTVQQAIVAAMRQIPSLADCCTESGELRSGYIANLNGTEFVAESDHPLVNGDVLLLLSADAGG